MASAEPKEAEPKEGVPEGAVPTLADLPNERITFAHVAHPSFPGVDASAAEWSEFLLSNIDDTNESLFYGIGEVPILSPAGCALLSARTAPLLGRGGAGVGSMHSYGVDLLQAFPVLLKELGERLKPLFANLFRPPAAPQPHLDLYSAHAIGYGQGPTREKALKLHVDASTFTATICVTATPDLRGTQLVFHGQQPLLHPRLEELQAVFARARRSAGVDVRQMDDARNHVQKLPRAGHALLHLGKHPHRTLPVEAGERHSWVLWWTEGEGAGQA